MGTLDAEVVASGITKQMEKDILREYSSRVSSDDDNDQEEEDEVSGDSTPEDAISENAHSDEKLEELQRELQKNLIAGGKESKHTASSEGEKDDVDSLVDLHEEDKQYRPFRDATDMDHFTSLSSQKATSTTASSIAPEEIKRRVRAGMEKKKRADACKRARAKGEASAVTRKRRENRENITSSTSAFWDG